MADNPKNPTRIAFDSPDHAQVDGYEYDIVKASDGTKVETIRTGKGEVIDGKVVIAINVQPTKFGTYFSPVRAFAGGILSPSSEPSNLWDRAPGAPGKPLVV